MLPFFVPCGAFIEGNEICFPTRDSFLELFQTHVVRSPVSIHVAEMESVGASSLEPGALVPSGFSVFRLQERRQGGVEFTKFDIFFASALAALILLALIFTLF